MESWQRHSQLKWNEIELPPRHWKWRMRHAAWYMAEQANQLWALGKRWHANFCTDMLNLAEFKGLVQPAIANLPTIIYFHENQFVYPNQEAKDRDLHFSITNFSSALAADAIWYNSKFNRDSMAAELEKLCNQWPDYPPRDQLQRIALKSKIVHPGIEPPAESRGTAAPKSPLHLVWAARWEHDKGPNDLLGLLRQLRSESFEFQLSLIGQSFRNTPNEFEQIKNEFSENIIHWGFQSSRQQYWKVLSSADVFLSTAKHEFFGLAACEAISAGLFPVLPNRLAYPELLSDLPVQAQSIFLYDEVTDAIKKIQSVGLCWDQFQQLQLSRQFQNRFAEAHQSKLMDQYLTELINFNADPPVSQSHD